MIITPKMWNIKNRIDFLEFTCKADPGDYMSKFELDELKLEYAKLERRERIGLKLVKNSQASTPSAEDKRHIS